MDAKPQHNYDVSINSADCPGCVWEHQQYIKQTVPAPQPPADATAMGGVLCTNQGTPGKHAYGCATTMAGKRCDCGADAVDRVGARFAVPREALEAIDAQVKAGLPAGPPVTGDGDAALAESIAKYHDEHAQFGGAGREFHERAASAIRTIYASGIARGRALGARDESEACEDIVRFRMRGEANGLADALNHALLDIQARRAGRTT